MYVVLKQPDFLPMTCNCSYQSSHNLLGRLYFSFYLENWSLLQALDLLPDDVLQELLQEKTIGNGTSGTTIGIPHLSGNTPTLSNGFSGSVGRDERGVSNRLQLQTPMVVSSDGEGSTSASVHSERRYRGSVVKRQRNSLACLDLPREFEQTVSALSRAQSTQLRFKRSTPPPNTLPSASQLLFVGLCAVIFSEI